MPVQRIKTAAYDHVADEIADRVEQLERSGATITDVRTVADETWIIYTAKAATRKAATKGRQTRKSAS